MEDKTAARIKGHTKKASDALASLKRAKSDAEKLEAAKALESAACQLRRALKKEIG